MGKNADKVAYPTGTSANGPYGGLSKRELFAAMAMQGMLARPDALEWRAETASGAVQYADALLAALEKNP